MSTNSSIALSKAFPILETAMNILDDDNIPKDKETLNTAENIFMEYIENHITYQEAFQTVSKISNGTCALDKIKAILATKLVPIPPAPEFLEMRNENRKKTRQWTNEEDNRLLYGIYKEGLDNWTAISAYVGHGRTRSQCCQRWVRGLDPRISKKQWSKEEEKKLLQLIDDLGDKSWTKISTYFGNRSDVQCRYKYLQIQRAKPGAQKNSPSKESTQVSPPSPPPQQTIPPAAPNKAIHIPVQPQAPAAHFIPLPDTKPKVEFPIPLIRQDSQESTVEQAEEIHLLEIPLMNSSSLFDSRPLLDTYTYFDSHSLFDSRSVFDSSVFSINL